MIPFTAFARKRLAFTTSPIMLGNMTHKLLPIFTALSLLAGAAIAADEYKGTDFKGTWQVTKTAPAPWLEVRPELERHHNKELENAKLVFADEKLTAPYDWMGCKKPKYKTFTVPFNGLFEGGLNDKERGLNDAAAEARKLGFTKEPVTSVNASCGELIYHFADNDTMLFALDNVIYTLTRVK